MTNVIETYNSALKYVEDFFTLTDEQIQNLPSRSYPYAYACFGKILPKYFYLFDNCNIDEDDVVKNINIIQYDVNVWEEDHETVGLKLYTVHGVKVGYSFTDGSGHWSSKNRVKYFWLDEFAMKYFENIVDLNMTLFNYDEYAPDEGEIYKPKLVEILKQRSVENSFYRNVWDNNDTIRRVITPFLMKNHEEINMIYEEFAPYKQYIDEKVKYYSSLRERRMDLTTYQFLAALFDSKGKKREK